MHNFWMFILYGGHGIVMFFIDFDWWFGDEYVWSDHLSRWWSSLLALIPLKYMKQITVLKSCCRDLQPSLLNIMCENEWISSCGDDTGPLVLTCKSVLSIHKPTQSTQTSATREMLYNCIWHNYIIRTGRMFNIYYILGKHIYDVTIISPHASHCFMAVG